MSKLMRNTFTGTYRWVPPIAKRTRQFRRMLRKLSGNDRIELRKFMQLDRRDASVAVRTDDPKQATHKHRCDKPLNRAELRMLERVAQTVNHPWRFPAALILDANGR